MTNIVGAKIPGVENLSSIDDGKIFSTDPIKLFKKWYQEAADHEAIDDPDAMNIATSSKDGVPTARMISLGGVTDKGFLIFTNYESQKGKQLIENPKAAITFFWPPMMRSIRITGTVEKVPEEDSIKEFYDRPISFQISAWTGDQRSVVQSRQILEDRMKELTKQYEGKKIPKPHYWGGFLIKPITIEFWCGGYGRIFDRIVFRHLQENETIDPNMTKEGENNWYYERVSP